MESHRILVHTSHIPVRWGDMDARGHVNNTIYFRFAEQARIEWVESVRIKDVSNEGCGQILVNASCSFLKPITFPATVDVALFIGKPGRSSLQTYIEIRCAGDDTSLYADGAAKIVWWNQRTGNSQPLPDFIREICAHG